MGYNAPELHEWGRKTCNERYDIYSLGMVLKTIWTQRSPGHGSTYNKFPRDFPANLKTLILECFETNPTDRPTAKQVLDRLKEL